MYCANCDLIISVTDIDAVDSWTVDTELELAADEDILAAKNLNLFSAGATVSVVNAFAAPALVRGGGGGGAMLSARRT